MQFDEFWQMHSLMDASTPTVDIQNVAITPEMSFVSLSSPPTEGDHRSKCCHQGGFCCSTASHTVWALVRFVLLNLFLRLIVCV